MTATIPVDRGLRLADSETVWEDSDGGLWFWDYNQRRWQNITIIDEGGWWVNEEGGTPNTDYAPYTPIFTIHRDVV